MIYSTKNMAGISAEKVFAEAQGMAQAVFKGEVRQKSMLIVKMEGSYSGPYYAFNSPTGGHQYKGSRPYYIVVVGSNRNIARLTRDQQYAAFSRFQDLRGYEDMYLFESDEVYHPHYSLLLSHRELRGRFTPERGQEQQIVNVRNVAVDRNSGDLRLVMAVDLSGMLIDEHYLTDVSNYSVESDDPVEIKEIRPIKAEDVTPAEKKYVGKATHLFILQSEGVRHAQEVEIKLRNRLPDWVASSSSDDDRDTGAPRFAQTTFGLKYLLQGIYDGYSKYSDNEPYYFELELKLDR